MAHKIHIQQTISNWPTVPTCYYQPDHHPHYTCVVHQFPWHDLDGFVIDKCGEPNIPLYTYFNRNLYDICTRNLTNGKTPGPDSIPNSILKNMPTTFHDLLFLFFIHYYKQQQIPQN
jgi:hypothetical protein